MDTTTALATTEQQLPTVPADVSAVALQSALGGDLKRLTTEDRLKYYGALCQFTGLNPLSKPFDWLELQGKLILYANKGCAEQLRKIHKVTVEIVERKFEYGCHIVRVKATDGLGRTDESIGAVPINERAQGVEMANALMKAETKAKRRVTLSICGLGMLDESELDTVREVKRAERAGNIVALTETAEDRAAALNATGKEPIEAEVIPAASNPVAQQEAVTTPADAAAPVPNTPEAGGAQPPPPPASNNYPAKVLDIVKNFDGKPSTQEQETDCVLFLISRGYLKEGQGINDIQSIDPAKAERIANNSRAFYRAVKQWAAQPVTAQ